MNQENEKYIIGVGGMFKYSSLIKTLRVNIIRLIFLLSFVVLVTPTYAEEDKQVLILIGPQYGLPIAEAITPAMVSRLQEGGISLDDIYVEYLDVHRNDDEQHFANLLDLLQHKLRNSNIEIIIAVNQGAVDFIAREGKDLFPQAPMLIPILEKEPVWAGTPRPLITLVSRQDAEGTLRYALDLFPATKRVVLITGKDDHRAPFLEPIRAALAALPTELIVEDTAALTHQEMLQHIASLPANTIAFYGSYFEDVTGKSFIPAEVAAEVADAADVPVFAFRDMHIMQGLVGGSVMLTSELGVQAAEISLDYLSGNVEFSDQTTSFGVANIPLFNWQQVKHFGADPDKLPANTVFFDKPLTLWEKYKEVIIVTAILLVSLAILSIILFLRNRQLNLARKSLHLYSEQLNELVLARTAELERTNKELEAFTYSVSHDLRAPLRSLHSFSETLMSRYSNQMDKQGRHYLARIQNAAQRMGNLINDLLNLSQIIRTDLEYQHVDISRLAAEIMTELQEKEPQRRVEIEIAAELTARGDVNLLWVVMENLLGNAWKFSSRQPQARIEVGLTKEDGEAAYFVRDNGTGFDMAYAHNLFGPFQRLHGMEEFPGTGIGLATVQRIINRHGGQIWAEGEVGKGATFYFALPGK